MLVFDRDGNGRLGSGASIIRGFAALADLDANHDGVIDNQDPMFSDLRVLADTNQDGTIGCRRDFQLASLRIESISLASIPAAMNFAGNEITPTVRSRRRTAQIACNKRSHYGYPTEMTGFADPVSR
jgi:hypothetical protein